MNEPVFRFAPSPTGALHLGHAYSALLNQNLARQAGGRLLLRIEDIDGARCTPANEAGILRDLEWLGLEWEMPVRRQSEHFSDYRAALDHLIAMDLVYPAFLSRGEARALVAAAEAGGASWLRDPDGVPHYPPHDRQLGKGERQRSFETGRPFAWRLDMARAIERTGQLCWDETGAKLSSGSAPVIADPAAWGDVIVARKEFPASYHLAVVVDDALQGVTDVVRGEDLFHATSVHRLLQTLLGLPAPRYRHHPLILGPDGRKLSKSAGSESLAGLRAGGATPQDVRRMVEFR